jgi:hypothetical protein
MYPLVVYLARTDDMAKTSARKIDLLEAASVVAVVCGILVVVSLFYAMFFL